MGRIIQEIPVCDLCSSREGVGVLVFSYQDSAAREVDVCGKCYERFLPETITRTSRLTPSHRRVRRASVYVPKPEEL